MGDTGIEPVTSSVSGRSGRRSDRRLKVSSARWRPLKSRVAVVKQIDKQDDGLFAEARTQIIVRTAACLAALSHSGGRRAGYPVRSTV